MRQLFAFLKNRWDEILIFGVAIQLFVWSITTGNPVYVLIVAMSMVLIIILVYITVDRVAKRRARKHIGENVAFKVPRRGIIFTTGKQISTIEFAIQHQKPEFLGLVCTDVTENFVEELITKVDLAPDNIHKRIVDANDIREIRNVTNNLIDWMIERGLRRPDIVVDVTGGMTTLSVGVFSAADERQIDSQYTRSRYDELNKPIPGTLEAIFITRYSPLPGT